MAGVASCWTLSEETERWELPAAPFSTLNWLAEDVEQAHQSTPLYSVPSCPVPTRFHTFSPSHICAMLRPSSSTSPIHYSYQDAIRTFERTRHVVRVRPRHRLLCMLAVVPHIHMRGVPVYYPRLPSCWTWTLNLRPVLSELEDFSVTFLEGTLAAARPSFKFGIEIQEPYDAARDTLVPTSHVLTTDLHKFSHFGRSYLSPPVDP